MLHIILHVHITRASYISPFGPNSLTIGRGHLITQCIVHYYTMLYVLMCAHGPNFSGKIC